MECLNEMTGPGDELQHRATVTIYLALIID